MCDSMKRDMGNSRFRFQIVSSIETVWYGSQIKKNGA